jgi:hypothetical protein
VGEAKFGDSGEGTDLFAVLLAGNRHLLQCRVHKFHFGGKDLMTLSQFPQALVIAHVFSIGWLFLAFEVCKAALVILGDTGECSNVLAILL